jgi:pimeloyl-ACP methyl ester carboxylesterase
MGGNLAIDIAAELPDQISTLVLIESIPCMREMMMPGIPASALQYDSPYNNQILAMDEAAFLQMATGMAQNMTSNADKVELITGYILKSDRETYVYGYTDLLKLDLREKLSTLKTNNLILGASFPNKEVVQSTYENQYANLDNKEIIVADESRHFIMFDQSEWMYENINSFLSKKVQ